MKTTFAKLTTLIIVSLFFFCVGRMDAQTFSNEHLARFISSENGLPGNYIDDILIDDAGFLWAATSGEGLCRYDGNEFVTISTNIAPRIRNNFVRNIAEDGFRRLWVGSEGGLDVIDIENFTNIDISSYLPKGLAGQRVGHLAKSSDGCIWAVIGNTVVRFSLKESGEILACAAFTDLRINPNSVVLKDAEENGSVWLGIEGKIYRISAEGSNQLRQERIMENLDCGSNTYLSDFLIKDNEVWISSSGGIFRYNMDGSAGKVYRHDDSNPNSLSQNYITALAIGPDKRLIAASLLGLNIYNPLEDNFERVIYNPDTENRDLLSSNFINCMIVHGSNIWLGSENAGIIQLHPKRLAIDNYTNQKNDPQSIAPNIVNAVYQDSKGRIWVGSVESGISCLSDEWTGFRHLTSANAGLSHNSVSEFCEDDQGRIWAGSWGGGVDVLDGKAQIRSTMNINTCGDNGADLSFVGALEWDPYNRLMWIGTNSGVYFCNPEDWTVCSALEEQAAGCIGSLIDKEGRLWMGGQSGLQIFDLGHGSMEAGRMVFPFKSYPTKLDDPASETVEKVSCITQTADGTIWIGSTGNGFYKTIEQEGVLSFRNYSSLDGLSNDSVKYILEDNNGKLWISTENGLSLFDPDKESFTKFTEAEGLLSNQFYWNAGMKDSAGKLYFGSSDGLSVIDPSKSGKISVESKPGITSVTIGNRRYNNPYIQELILHERDKSITITFSDFAYNVSENSYRYILEGQGNSWIELPNGRNFISFNSLPRGRYTLIIRSDEGDESGVIRLPIRVKPYFYHSWIFFILILCAAVTAFLTFHKIRLKSLLHQKEILEKIVEERTLEIKQQKKLVEQKAAELERQNEVLLRQNEELAGSHMLQESHAVEDKFAKKCIDIIREHYKDPDFDVPSFCEEMGMSKTLLNRKMQESMGQAIGQFIRTYRLTIAKEMLVNNHDNKNISEIAYDCGFNDPKYFARCFQKEIGMTPSSYGKTSEQKSTL